MAKTSKKVAKSKEKDNSEAPEAQVPQEEQAQGNTLTVTDLQTLAQAIDIASRRGAYSAAEMSSIGAIYDKLAVFLKAFAEQRKVAEGGQ